MPPLRRLLPVAAAALAAPFLLLPGSGRADPAADTDFLFRLGMMEGHLIIGHQLLQAGHAELALPHFGHPVRELYDDVKDYVDAKRIAPFDKQLLSLEAAVTAQPKATQTEALYQSVIHTIEQARLATPEPVRASVPTMIKVCADTVDAASGEYAEAVNEGRIDSPVEYHDSRGYLTAVQQQTDALARLHTDPASATMINQFQTLLGKAAWIVEPLLPPETPRASAADYKAIAAQAVSVAGAQ